MMTLKTTIALFVFGPFALSLTAEPAPAVSLSKLEPFLEKNCLACHGPKRSKGGIRFDELSTSVSNTHTAETWQEVLDTLNAAEMPPEDEPQPSREELVGAIDLLTNGLHEAGKRLTDTNNPMMRQLNRREYQNTLQTLLGVSVDVSSLPDDPVFEGFDRVGNAQEMSAHLFESYRMIGKQALDKAFSRPAAALKPETKLIEPAKGQNNNREKRLRIATESIVQFAAEEKLENRANSRVTQAVRNFVAWNLYTTIPGSESGFIFGDENVGGELGSSFETPFPFPHLGRYRVTLKLALTAEDSRPDSRFLIQANLSGRDASGIIHDEIGTFELSKVFPEMETVTFEVDRQSDTYDRLSVSVLNQSVTTNYKRGNSHTTIFMRSQRSEENSRNELPQVERYP